MHVLSLHTLMQLSFSRSPLKMWKPSKLPPATLTTQFIANHSQDFGMVINYIRPSLGQHPCPCFYACLYTYFVVVPHVIKRVLM